MGVLAGPFVATAALLGISGILKLRRPAPTAQALVTVGLRRLAPLARPLGAAELVTATGALLSGGSLFPWLVTAFYVAFAGFVGFSLASKKDVTDCGCFGAAQTPPTVLHLLVNLAAAAVAAGVAAGPGGGLRRAVEGQPLLGVPFLVLVLVCTALAYAALTLLPRTLNELAEASR
jgi:hypothetical protein